MQDFYPSYDDLPHSMSAEDDWQKRKRPITNYHPGSLADNITTNLYEAYQDAIARKDKQDQRFLLAQLKKRALQTNPIPFCSNCECPTCLGQTRRNPGIRTAKKGPRPDPKGPAYCIFVKEDGAICGEATSEKKQYCLDHIEYSPDIQSLMETMELREEEIKKIVKKGIKAVKPDSRLIEEVLGFLGTMGPESVAKISRMIGIPEKVVEPICKFLVKKNILVSLINKQRKDGQVYKLKV